MSKLYVCKEYETPYEEGCTIITTLDEHDSELLDKVAEKLKYEFDVCKDCTVIDCDTEYFRPMCEKGDEGFSAEEVKEIIDTVIEEMKAEIE